MVVQFWELSQGNLRKVLKSVLAPKGAGLGVYFFYFGANGLTVSHFFDDLDLPITMGMLYVKTGPP